MTTAMKRTTAGMGALLMLGLALALLTVGGGKASAQTVNCTSDPAGNCGAQVNPYNNAFAITAHPSRNAPVLATPLDTTPSQDFSATQPGSNPDGRTFEFAPNNNLTGWCISQPAKNARLVLRQCNDSKWQTFTGVNTRDTTGTYWRNNASGQFVLGNGTGKQIGAVSHNPATLPKGAYWNFQSAAIAP